jgi:MFS family permease
MVFAYLSYALSGLGFALAQDALVATILYALPVYPLSSTAAHAFGALLSKDDKRARAIGLVNGAQNAGTALGPVIGGLSAEFVFRKAQPVSWITLVCNLLALLVALTLLKGGAGQKANEISDEAALTTADAEQF